MQAYHGSVMRCAALAMALQLVACAQDGDPRAQTVLYVDTDVPVPTLADTLRVEVIEPAGFVSESRTYVRPNARDWPVSLGVMPREDGAPTLLRLRLYGASHIAGRNPSELAHDLDPDDPLPAFVIDRLVELAAPETGIRRVAVLLRGDCMGVPADLTARLTCASGELEPTAEPSAALDGLSEAPDPEAPPRPGSWSAAEETPCTGSPRADSGTRDDDVCVRGGIFFLGDERLGVNAGAGSSWASIPERLVRVSPFFMDRHEVTVGRVRAAIAAGFEPDPAEYADRSEMSLCTFTGDGSADELPMSCISKAFAESFCAFDGGRTIPTEAQWEYAASSRGEERMYVWGSTPATCDDAVFARIGLSLSGIFGIRPSDELGTPGQCAAQGEGPQPVGSIERDVTADGIVDLNGNIQEWTRDSFIALTHECWDHPQLTDPECDVGGDEYITRGGIWSGVLGSLPVSLRKSSGQQSARDPRGGSFTGFATGFRCVRSGS